MQIDIPANITKKLNVEKAELEFDRKTDLVIYILGNYYGIKQKRKLNDKRT